ncbi:hypothetical protein EI94DRAFT_1614732, partial [Lactarius quietus]
YHKWCDANKVDLMLPGDLKQRREAAMDACHKTQQTTLANHFPAHKAVIPYSERAFEAVSLEWLIQTNQLIQAFKHFSFKKMLDMAS